jgi:hypothetical protein
MQEVYPWQKYTSGEKAEVILAKKLYFISLLGMHQKQYIKTLIDPYHVSSFPFLPRGQSHSIHSIESTQSLLLSTS